MAKASKKVKKSAKKAKAKKKTIAPIGIPAGQFVEEMAEVAGTVQELAQEALDSLSVASPSMGLGGPVLRILSSSDYEVIEARLSQIVDS